MKKDYINAVLEQISKDERALNVKIAKDWEMAFDIQNMPPGRVQGIIDFQRAEVKVVNEAVVGKALGEEFKGRVIDGWILEDVEVAQSGSYLIFVFEHQYGGERRVALQYPEVETEDWSKLRNVLAEELRD